MSWTDAEAQGFPLACGNEVGQWPGQNPVPPACYTTVRKAGKAERHTALGLFHWQSVLCFWRLRGGGVPNSW